MTEDLTTPRTYLFALVDGGGTVPPELGTVRRLVERGHRVTVLAEDSMRAEVDATGATFRPWADRAQPPDRTAEHDPYRDWECKTPMQLFNRLLDTQFVGPAPAYAADVAGGDRRRAPRPRRVVVLRGRRHGRRRGGRRALRRAVPEPVPAAGPGHAADGPRAAARPPARSVGSATAPSTGSSDRLWAKGLPGLNELRADHGLGAAGDTSSTRSTVLGGSSCSPRPTSTSPADLPANVRYVGPVLDDPTWAETPWTAPAGDDPLVLVALSSTFQDHAGCLQRIVDALGDAAGARPRHHRPRARARRDRPRPTTCSSCPPLPTRRCCDRRRRRHPRRPRHRGPVARRRRAAGRPPPRS